MTSSVSSPDKLEILAAFGLETTNVRHWVMDDALTPRYFIDI